MLRSDLMEHGATPGESVKMGRDERMDVAERALSTDANLRGAPGLRAEPLVLPMWNLGAE